MKTRPLAQALVEAGHVRLNRTKLMKPGHQVAAGDVLTISLNQRILVMKVVGFAERRGAFPQARLLYEELSAPHDAPAQKESATDAGNC